MRMPDPDNEQRHLSINDFLDIAQHRHKKKIYRAILSPLSPLVDRIKATWHTPDGVPEIRIMTNARANETELRDIINIICLADGLLEQSLRIQELALKNFGASKIPKPFGSFSFAKACMMWSLSHEVFHYLRRHALVEKHFGSNEATKHALEYDADLCATAAFYRYLQYFSPSKSCISLKKTALQLIYFALRVNISNADINFTGTNTHPFMGARIIDILEKLAMLNDSGVPDPNGTSIETILHSRELYALLMQLELKYKYLSTDDVSSKESPLLSFAIENHDLKYTLNRHERWDEIQSLIDRFSRFPRSVIDNEASIAFCGDVFSLPR